MKKYTFELKKRVVKEYLDGQGSALDLAAKHRMTTASLVARWVSQVRSGGFKALHNHGWIRYPLEFKMEVVDYYLNNHVSLSATARYFEVDNPTISKWVSNYRKKGIDGLEPKDKDRYQSMKKQPRPTTEKERHLQAEQRLEHELYQVKMDRDALKKLLDVTRKNHPMETKQK